MPLIILGLLILSRCKKERDLPSDNDGNVYDTVVIGTQVWLAENLKTTKYNNGTAISLITDNTTWVGTTTAAYSWYDNDPVNKDVYGALYNWYAVDTKLLCPVGWHVPTFDEWTTMINYLGGENAAGAKLKETGTKYWSSPNDIATNETGFTARPSGGRSHFDGTFGSIGFMCSWWVSSYSENNQDNAYKIYIYDNKQGAYNIYHNKKTGISARCIKNN